MTPRVGPAVTPPGRGLPRPLPRPLWRLSRRPGLAALSEAVQGAPAAVRCAGGQR